MKLDVNKANGELQEKSYETIQKETSIKWAERAAAAYVRSQSSKTIDLKMKWFADACAYQDEALEHSAMSLDLQLFNDIEKTLKTSKTRTIEEIKKWKQG